MAKSMFMFKQKYISFYCVSCEHAQFIFSCQQTILLHLRIFSPSIQFAYCILRTWADLAGNTNMNNKKKMLAVTMKKNTVTESNLGFCRLEAHIDPSLNLRWRRKNAVGINHTCIHMTMCHEQR